MKFIYPENDKKYEDRQISQEANELCDRVKEAFREKAFPNTELERMFAHPFFKSPYQMPIAGEMMDRMRASKLFEKYANIIKLDSVNIEWEPYELHVRGQHDTLPIDYYIGLPISHGFSTIHGKMPSLDLTPMDKLDIDESIVISGISTDGRNYFVNYPCYLRNNFATPEASKSHCYKKLDILLMRLKNKLGIGINGFTERIDRKIRINVERIDNLNARKVLTMLRT